MFQRLVNHNDDIRRLVEKGYAVAFDNGYLIVRDIPYLGEKGELLVGAIVTKLVLVDEERVTQDDHQIFFAGGVPHNLDGAPIPNLGGGPVQLALSEANNDVVVQRSFSNKPRLEGRFKDFFEKIESYVAIIAGPAIERYRFNPHTFRTREMMPDSVFKLHDTLSSRAEIADLSAKFANDVVAIIGLGGTGAYLLDFLVKTPVREIRAFDRDPFHVHNAFRSPGRLSRDELGEPKAHVYHSRYASFRTGLSFHTKFVDESCSADFDGVTFGFICVDKGSSRERIINLFVSKGIPFIDAGMGLNRKRGPIGGMLRVTYYPPEVADKMSSKDFVPFTDHPDDIYRNNIQIGELNAMNAALAVVRFKQLRGFYAETSAACHLLWGIDDLKLASVNVDEV